MNYFIGSDKVAHKATARYLADQVIFSFLENDSPQQTWNTAYIAADFQKERLVLSYSPTKHSVEISGSKEIEEIVKQYPFLRNNKQWESKRTLVSTILVILGLILAGLALIYFFILPWFSGYIAKQIPMEYEIKLGKALFEQTIVDYDKKDSASLKMNEFIKNFDFNTKYPIQITVVHSDQINAFAMPGGNIVVFDGLLNKMVNYEELIALLSHEVSHVHYQHTLQSMAREFSGQLLLYAVIGDQSFIINAAHQLTGLSYSRNLEEEADQKGFDIMKANHVNPQGILDLFNRLKSEESDLKIPELMSTHPLTEEREKDAHKRMEENPYKFEKKEELQTIFEELKQ